MLDELLDAIVAEAAEDRYQVLADWLEEHDDPRRAELLRLHRRLLATCCEPKRYPERTGWQSRLVELLAGGVKPCVPQQTVVLGKRAKVPMTFSFIPPGSFLMGSPEGEEGRIAGERLHRVDVSEGFWLGVDLVTQGQWRAGRGRTMRYPLGDDRPVQQVSWSDCEKYCTRLAEKVGQRFRLPTEAEWEHACRAGTTTPFFFGQSLSYAQGNFGGTRLYDHQGLDIYKREATPVGSYPPNAWGLYDMHGNVWQWCSDGYVDEGSDPSVGVVGSYRVLRGGAWSRPMLDCRSACRGHALPSSRAADIGCRLVLSLDEQEA
jgi:uncharacterized protein (TIGR02996 family)